MGLHSGEAADGLVGCAYTLHYRCGWLTSLGGAIAAVCAGPCSCWPFLDKCMVLVQPHHRCTHPCDASTEAFAALKTSFWHAAWQAGRPRVHRGEAVGASRGRRRRPGIIRDGTYLLSPKQCVPSTSISLTSADSSNRACWLACTGARAGVAGARVAAPRAACSATRRVHGGLCAAAEGCLWIHAPHLPSAPGSRGCASCCHAVYPIQPRSPHSNSTACTTHQLVFDDGASQALSDHHLERCRHGGWLSGMHRFCRLCDAAAVCQVSILRV